MSLRVQSAVARVTRTVVPQWPISSFIAVNPRSSDEAAPFGSTAPIRDRAAFGIDFAASRITEHDLAAAVQQLVPEVSSAGSVSLAHTTFSALELVVSELLSSSGTFARGGTQSHAPDRVDALMAKWVAAYLDPHPLWGMPGKNQGFWAAWRSLIAHDPQLSRAAHARIRALPTSLEGALDAALAGLGVPAEGRDEALRHEVSRTPGWTAHIKWRANHTGDINLASYIAARVCLRWALGLPAIEATSPAVTVDDAWSRADALLAALCPEAPSAATRASVARVLALHPAEFHAETWQTAYELHYREAILSTLDKPASSREAPTVQVVMCIDTRSEGMRRHLEKSETVETFGFAGFFGVPLRFTGYQARGSIDALPALLSPKHSVTESPVDIATATRRGTALRRADAVVNAWHSAENTPAAPFALAETTGWFSGISTFCRTVLPATTAAITQRARGISAPKIRTQVTALSVFSLDERAGFAENALRMMGISALAPLVVLAGHASTSANNLYQSTLDCGACGGNPGGASARAAAAIFNDPAVRAELALRGWHVPSSTHVVAAEHNTVSDEITILDPHLIPPTHRDAVQEFSRLQSVAADALVTERGATLPGGAGQSLKRLRTRAHDWAEVYPELGLAGNAAMIIGPRSMTRGIDLERRVFLHSYEADLDPGSAALETIMTAPLVVAQWISHQYYFSTVDQNRWGAGTKTIHNAIGTVGVLSGHTGDLRMGLPLQSVAFGEASLHEPMRLAVLMQAPLLEISAIIARNQVLRHLFDNRWITLTARDTATSPWHRYGNYGWVPLTTTTEGA